ncbi:DUF5054 domain-containing protein [Rossellomorea aquimaris]|uniref:DUF5054 domain-containing protein n=1 Tax=Rossellomorea aquimaris TaxID=189382 RepID=A0A5D4U6P0_9BACI|nr:DUF5054 domain-containing protein [Rossellomorea aquimaris]TYS76476.1 DUF5054 domain-containing protein [Rossellomorea aquimaris]TYS83065.1 DUF5054 domain-containing protein [Rossellomorea aquimaris]
MKDIEVVHVIFKTHLDLGFTDLEENVTNQYMSSYIPKAIQLSEELAKEGGDAQFVWTTGSWLIHEYLKRGDEQQAKKMEEAIHKGYVSWHGLPFTTHTELMDRRLLEHALSISKNLDERFGKHTISSKMTDVPGHTNAMVSSLAENGIEYLHLGVNPASKVPNVPNLFRWRGSDGTEVVVNYADNYGDVLKIDGLNEVMVFAHTGDNCGPPSIEEIKHEFHQLAKKFPNARIKASTMDEFAVKLRAIKHRLPIVLEEIGDTWIHGTGTDPKKISHYRELLRLRNKWFDQGRMQEYSKEYKGFSDALLLIPEHTWGLDEKKYLNDYKNYSKQDFQRARKQNRISKDAVPDKYSYIGSFAMHEFDGMSEQLFSTTWKERSYRFFERSWNEQRAYLQKAVAFLSEDKQKEVEEAFLSLTPDRLEGMEGNPLDLDSLYKLGAFEAAFSVDGSISKLVDASGKEWADQHHPLGVITYETFGVENYHTWFQQYVVNIGQTYRWSEADQGKPGIELVNPIPKKEKYKPKVESIRKVTNREADHVHVRLKLPNQAVEYFGAPRVIELMYLFSKTDSTIEIELNWFDKDANRLPEAIWFSFIPMVDNHNLWKMDKIGEWVSPLEVVKNGNRNLHAVQTGVAYHGADGKAVIESKDAPLVSPGKPRLLELDNTFSSLEGGFHFNLYNNVWGTNFPMWYEEDAKFRFSIKL